MLSREASIDIDKLSKVIVMYTSLTIIYPVIVHLWDISGKVCVHCHYFTLWVVCTIQCRPAVGLPWNRRHPLPMCEATPMPLLSLEMVSWRALVSGKCSMCHHTQVGGTRACWWWHVAHLVDSVSYIRTYIVAWAHSLLSSPPTPSDSWGSPHSVPVLWTDFC